jgi:hypothetical protein
MIDEAINKLRYINNFSFMYFIKNSLIIVIEMNFYYYWMILNSNYKGKQDLMIYLNQNNLF